MVVLIALTKVTLRFVEVGDCPARLLEPRPQDSLRKCCNLKEPRSLSALLRRRMRCPLSSPCVACPLRSLETTLPFISLIYLLDQGKAWDVLSARKRLQMRICGAFSRFRFCKLYVNSPRQSFVFAFVMNMLGTHRPQQLATITKVYKIRGFSFAFIFAIQQREKSWIPECVFGS